MYTSSVGSRFMLSTSQAWLHIINWVRRNWSTTSEHRNQTMLPTWQVGQDKHLPWWWEHSTLCYRGSLSSAAYKVPGWVARTGSRDPNLGSISAVLWIEMAFKHLPLPTLLWCITEIKAKEPRKQHWQSWNYSPRHPTYLLLMVKGAASHTTLRKNGE